MPNDWFILRAFRWVAVVTASCLWVASGAAAATYDESVSGDLSSNQFIPASFILTAGTNSLIGSIGSGGGADSLDLITIGVPPGMQLTSFVNSNISTSDHQDFIGFQLGSSFVGDVMTSANYVGLVHFGTSASNTGVGNPPGSPTSTLGLDMLPIMNTTGLAAGASGFTAPLGAGKYTFAIGQLIASDTATSYQFDINVVPEPATMALMGLGGLALLAAARR